MGLATGVISRVDMLWGGDCTAQATESSCLPCASHRLAVLDEMAPARCGYDEKADRSWCVTGVPPSLSTGFPYTSERPLSLPGFLGGRVVGLPLPMSLLQIPSLFISPLLRRSDWNFGDA